MKKRPAEICLVILISFAMLLGGCGQADDPKTSSPTAPGAEIAPENEPESVPSAQPPATEGSSKALVVWFSATGTTEGIAQRLAEYLSADSYEIVPETPYTAADLDYTDTGSRSSAEQNDASARLAIAGALPDMQQYDAVFIGYPIWHGQAPRIVSTFLEGCDLSQKTLIPFCTSGSSGIGSSADNLQPLAEGAVWADGIRFAANVSDEELFAWADEILPGSDIGDTLYVRIGDTVLSATMADNSSASALKNLLSGGDLTVSMHDYGGFEKVGPLGSTLPSNDESITTEPGDIVLYQGDHITIYYGENTWDFTLLGRLRGVTAQELKDLLGTGDVTVTFSVS